MSKNLCTEKIFAKVFERHAKDLHDFLYYKYGQSEDLNDVVQETFIKLWDQCKKVSFEKARAFLFKVAKNNMLNRFKHDKIVLKYQQAAPKNKNIETPEYIFEEKEFYDKYRQALGKLTEEQRVAFLLNKVEGKKHQEIAEMLNITRKVVEYRIYSAFKIIKAEIKEFK